MYSTMRLTGKKVKQLSRRESSVGVRWQKAFEITPPQSSPVERVLRIDGNGFLPLSRGCVESDTD